MIPLTDASRRPAHFPIVTLTIIVINFVVFLVELAKGDAFVQQWALVPRDVSSGHHLVTILTAMFMHASWSHLIGNMIFLWAFAPVIEDAMGPTRYAIFYILGGIAAACAQIVFNPHSTIPNLGASGAIAAVMGAFLVTFPRDQIRSILVIFFFISVTYISAVVLIGVWILYQLWNAGTIAATQTGGVAYLAHVGGFIFGAVFARLFEDPQRIAQET
ncbi:MAG: rhomboid family intramembrane serine protease [Candidatus Eremiobacteraeota bacterium]|nr:rhomboid family intramembrane serine protease [Candidatus Eremiobacteraeota bacterium]